MKVVQHGEGKTDRYDFATVVDKIFKESVSTDDTVARYTQMRSDLDNLFRQNIALKAFESEDTE